jgi:hypothetical protein
MTVPKLDPRTLDDVVAQTEALAAAFTPWRPKAGGALDFGGALIRLFARMVDHLITQLNEVPNKHLLAFTNLLGATRIPARPARAPVTFTLAPGDGTSVVPANAQVAATTADGTITFETELTLALTRAALQAVIVRDGWDPARPETLRFADCTALATGPAGTFDALGARDPATSVAIQHQIFVDVTSLVGLTGVSQLVVTANPGAHPLPPITWTARDATGQPIALPAMTAAGTAWTLVVPTAQLAALAASTVDGAPARWLCGTLPTTAAGTPPLIVTASAVIAAQNVAPDAALANGQKLDFARDLTPFGLQPAFNDVFYVSSTAGFAIGSAQVTLAFTFTAQAAIATVPSGDLNLAWESWDGATATPLAVQDATARFTTNGTVKLTVPAGGIPIATVGGVAGRWVRVRIIAGNYGVAATVVNNQFAQATFRPPWIHTLSLAWTATVAAAALPIKRLTGLTYTDVTATPTTAVVVYQQTPELEYAPTVDLSPALHLGFDRAFEPALTALYVQVAAPAASVATDYTVEPPPLAPPRLIWEYWNGAWTAFPPDAPVDDGTQRLSRSGLVRFLPQADAAPLAQYGRRLYWLRARAASAAFTPMPRLGRIATNTVWARHAHTTVREVLGASNGGRAQVFTLAQTPVLDGAQIEVGEPAEGALAWVRWHAVADFLASGPRDRHYTLDAETGEITFGDGTSGMIPPTGAQNVRAGWYQSGGGPTGNVAAGAIAQVKASIAHIVGVTNAEPATGGAALESLDAMTARAATTLRHGGYAVTAQDFADLARASSLAVARAVAITPAFLPISQAEGPLTGATDLFRDGKVIVIIVPAQVRPGEAPTVDTLAAVQDSLTARCAPGATVMVTGPAWVAADIVAHVAAGSIEDSDAVLVAVRAAIARLLDPIVGGDGAGWDFGRRPRRSDLIACITAVPGVDHLTYLNITCAAPFDDDDRFQPTGDPAAITFDQMSLFGRLLVYPRTITVAAPGAVP